MGPLPSAWVRAWALDAAASMRIASSGAVAMPFKVAGEFFDRNRVMMMEWVEVAREGEVFTWEGEGEPDALLAVLQYWRNLAQVRHDLMVVGEAPAMDADAERFTQALRRAALDALVVAGRIDAGHALRMEASWPRLSAPATELQAADHRIGGPGPAVR